MINLDLYLEQIQNNSEQMSAAGIGFAIDSPHTGKETLTDKLTKNKKKIDKQTDNE